MVSNSHSGNTRSALRTELTGRFQSPLRRYFARRATYEEADDLVQEVFARVLTRSEKVEVKNLEAFVFTSARNLLRDRARRREVQGRWLSSEPPPDGVSEVSSPERVVQGRETLSGLLAALDELPEKTRDVFILHRLEGLKYREIADQYGISASAVEKHMIKALAKVTDAMAER